jgi:hypothetical protein
MNSFLKKAIKTMPFLKDFFREREILIKKCGIFPPGHFYSPLPDLEEVKKAESKIWSNVPVKLEAIDLNEDEQL